MYGHKRRCCWCEQISERSQKKAKDTQHLRLIPQQNWIKHEVEHFELVFCKMYSVIFIL